jgi:MFS family permease
MAGGADERRFFPRLGWYFPDRTFDLPISPQRKICFAWQASAQRNGQGGRDLSGVARGESAFMLLSPSTVETKESWVVASVALLVMMMAFGAAWIIAVGLKDVAAEFGGARSVPALASSLAWLGSGTGGIIMSRIADRIGTRWTVICGALMIGLGLAISTSGPAWSLWIGHGLFIGLIGLGGINAPMYVYVSRWFERRRGSALALISSGSYLAGALWPVVFEQAIASIGWRQTMLTYAVAEIVVIVPLAAIYFRHPPELVHSVTTLGAGHQARVLGLPRNAVFAMMCGAGVLCCIPMAMPQGHLVAFCSDLGINRAMGALMLSVLLGTAFLSRQIWGLISDRIGGLATVLIGSAWQAAAMTGFLLTQNEAGLFTVAAAFGLGFSGIIPAYVLTVRELFPPSEASWRIPTLLLFSGFGMAAGGWIAGLLYDHFGYYAPAFAAGVGANCLNLLVIGTLVARGRYRAAYAS